jgi:hypothetical protein
MEIDFSNQIKAFFESRAAKRSGPKSAAQTPAPISDQKKGSSKNKKGSAGKEGSKIVFSEKVETSLKNKVKLHNEKNKKKVSLSQLKKVYRRGLGAFSTSHRPNQTRGSWAMARVNMFLKMMSGGDVKDSYRKADQDIASASVCSNIKESDYLFVDFEAIDFEEAKADLIKANIDIEKESNIDLPDIEYSEAEKKTLNKPFRLPSGSKKKFGVYVKNDKGNVVMVKFGDPKMEIKRDDPERRKNFRARHQCDTNVGPKWKARYWSCKFWSKKPVSSMASSDFAFSDCESSDWGWDDSGFCSQEELLNEWKSLATVKEIIEEDNL